MMLEALLKARREEILKECAKYGAHNVRVLSSVSRGEADEQDDIDFLPILPSAAGCSAIFGLWLEVQDLLGVKVGVVSSRGIKPRICKHVR